jgi:LmbE family N-acetylglucosaminyl deacetylase
MKFLNKENILCLSPHPDDIEYGALASMLKYKDTKFEILVLSNGGDFDKSSGTTREKECYKIWENIKNIKGQFFSKTFVKEYSEDQWVSKIENIYNINSYDCILTTTKFDSHFEHRMVNNITYALARTSKCGIISYKTPSTLESWIPNFYVDIDKNIDKKIELLRLFKTQLKKESGGEIYFEKNKILSFHTNYISTKIEANFVETFKINRLFG